MATNDVATLGIQVTTTGAAEGKRSLDELAASGDRAAASTTRLGQANADAAKKYASPQYRQQADDLAKLVGQIDPTVAALGRLDAQQAKLAADMANGNWGRFEQTSLTLANASGLLGMAFSGTGAIIAGVVAAIGLGIVAFEKGSAEVENFNRALIMTGDIAGLTSQRMADMARNIAAATNTTQHSA